MASDKANRNQSRKKQLRLEVTETLRTALAGLKEALGEKKFESRISKAARLLSRGMKSRKTEAPL
jgi:hypothetical protein